MPELYLGFTYNDVVVDDVDNGVCMNDWRRKVRAPTPYRVGGTSVHVNSVMMAKLGILALLILTAVVLFIPATDYGNKYKREELHAPYNSTYPLSLPITTSEGTQFRIAVVTDLDTDSKHKSMSNTWMSYLRTGYITLSQKHDKVTVRWDAQETVLQSKLSSGGRGMELSELIAFNGKLYTCDDRTGIIYEITKNNNIIPWVVLQDGDGNVEKGKHYYQKVVIL